MNTQTIISGPHTHAKEGVSLIMATVMLALLPATVFGVYMYGWPALNLLIITVAAAILSEAFGLWMMGKSVRLYLFDGSAVLTGWLLALTLPPWAPWWIGALGSALAIIVGKQVFGGMGQNVFNPAMLARVALLVSFPVPMTTWIDPKPLFSQNSPGFFESLAITFKGIPHVDSMSSASVLGHTKTEFTLGHMLSQSLPDSFSTLHAALGFTNGSLGETSAVLIVIGGLLLLARRIITWHIPVSTIGSVALLALVFHFINPERYVDPIVHLLSGGLMLGAFFIATDLVTSPSTPKGQLLFGAGCGAVIFTIRTWGAFPEGVGFAVLIMNAVSPLIDHYVRPRIYGRDRKGKVLPVAARQTPQTSPNGKGSIMGSTKENDDVRK